MAGSIFGPTTRIAAVEAFVIVGDKDYVGGAGLRPPADAAPRQRRALARVGAVDEICPALAQALGCGPDSGRRLADLVSRNAFIEQLRDRSGWYRLHPLLLDFLRSRATDTAERRELHRRAADRFAAQGEPRSALRYALQAEAWGLAAELVGTHVVTWTVRQPPAELLRQRDLIHYDQALE